MLIVGLVLAWALVLELFWLGWQLYWFKTRHDWLQAKEYIAAFPATGVRKVPHPRLLITVFHEEAMSQILLRNASEEELAKVRRLFPEARDLPPEDAAITENW